MALINCNECGKQISDQASSCPHCGAPVAGNPAAPSVAAPSVAATSLAAETVKNPSTFKYILYGTFVVVVAISCMSGGKTSNTPREFNANEAIFLCQHAIKQVSRDPEKAEVPLVSNVGSGDEYVFVWGPQTKLTRLRNGLGLEVGVPAVCKVSHTKKNMTSLSVDGKTIF
ncbi:zinc ribbon domain-containing protein [Comamonas sp. MYb21]|uniref:zinc-ribbon domain-containing protein n=1 Tax=unclassified Comamonas TaxID=2638500 RepID=UPI0011DD21F4|nr:zinc ribbon domain-containing protein [Comamonas sp. B-9]